VIIPQNVKKSQNHCTLVERLGVAQGLWQQMYRVCGGGGQEGGGAGGGVAKNFAGGGVCLAKILPSVGCNWF
jgi:hypothetical protein